MVSRLSPHLAARLLTALLALVIASGCAIVPAGIPLSVVRGGGLTIPAATPAASAAPTPVGPTIPVAPATALRPAPRPGRFSMDLYRRNDHVPQYNASWCVGASMQMMINLMET